ncbi:NADPH-Fe(3+) oxidoreductase subunit alpha [Frankliniella fusca]|uniref:NADPH-Fe(3+) oxidoreductase subunit alpha n=1 Tax=Frankliniella fusca TaxID=407009 RepID=A0AAE1H8I2_9NEOP|nr:NADPH-Fe(3+) oxidoreductase subunit alpha [Frankliniella fusca]
MRSRHAKFRHGLDDDELKLHRRRNQEAVERHRVLGSNTQRKSEQNQWTKYEKQYEHEIRQYYAHVCNCCGRLMRESQLKLLDRRALVGSKEFLDSIFWISKTDVSKFCRYCCTYIEKIKTPPLSLCNGLEFPKVDKKIAKLNRVEERLLAPRHIFQTIWTFQGPNGQYKTKGGIVNVPIDIDTTVKSLPRNVNDSHMIHVRVARKMEYVRDYMSGIVRPKLLYDAAKKFVTKPLPREEHIQLNENWVLNNNCNEDMYPSDDEEFVRNTIYETMLTSDNLSSAFNGLLDEGLRIAPAEGYVPTSILFDENCEYLAFPKVFGGFKMSPEYHHMFTCLHG